MDYAFEYIMEGNSLETEADYPYKAKKERCRYEKSRGVGKVKSYANVPRDNVAQMKASIQKTPVSVAVEANKTVF